jgi:hypothetical protein
MRLGLRVRLGLGLGLAASIVSLALLAALAADDSETLKGNVTKDGQTRLSRPHVAVPPSAANSAASGVALAAPKLKANLNLDAGSFDLNTQRRDAPALNASINANSMNGWIQGGSQFPETADVHSELDRFFATDATQNRFQLGMRRNPHAKSSCSIFVRMGLCGTWDEQGDGHRRWALLNQELHSNTSLQQGWQDWQRQVSAALQDEFPELTRMRGSTALHVAVRSDGFVDSITDYRGPEQPLNSIPRNDNMSRELSNAIARIGRLPSFPMGSHAPEAHILIYAAH